MALLQNDFPTARRTYLESLEIFSDQGERRGVAYCLEGLGKLAFAEGYMERAARLYSAAGCLRRIISVPLTDAERADAEHDVDLIRARMGETFAMAWSDAGTWPLEQALAFAQSERQAVFDGASGGGIIEFVPTEGRRMKIAFLLVALVFLMACTLSIPFFSPGPTLPVGTPDWVGKLAAQYMNEPVQNPPRAIYRAQYQGQIVYYVPPVCCDRYGELYDNQGKLICAPDGGLTGRGDGKCPDFRRNFQTDQLVWIDPRQPK